MTGSFEKVYLNTLELVMRRRLYLLLSLPFIVLALSTPIAAQTTTFDKAMAKAEKAVSHVETACAYDVTKFCPNVTPGDGRIALCLLAHEDKLAKSCLSTALRVGRNFDLAVSNVFRAAEVCEKDITTVCGQIEPGEGRIIDCLIENQPKLSAQCRAEVAGLAERIK
jgi:Cysteine rich repeat